MPKLSIGPFISHWHGVIVSLTWLLAAFLCGLLAYRLVFFLYRKIDKNPGDRTQLVFRECRAPLRVALPIYAIDFAMPALHLPATLVAPVNHLLGLLEIVAIAWLAIKLAFVLSESLAIHYEAAGKGDFKTPRIVTQIRLLRRIVLVAISVLSLGVPLMSFRWGRELGRSVLPSARIAGLAARPAIANLVAGFQLAITQPIRLEDVVIVENEW